MAQAVDYAVEHGAAVVNMSVYGENRNAFLDDTIRRARAAGVIVVAAAGNEGTTTPEYPAAYPEAISVGAMIESGALAVYSGRGDWVKLAAPACTPTTQLGGGFGAGCGTSGATPFVAGIVGLLRSRAPFATATQIETALAETARPVSGVRFGSVDAFAALQRLGRPGPTLEPTIHGPSTPGETLTAHSGVWAGAGLEITYRWERCREGGCEAAGSARTYVVLPSDGGTRLRVTLSSPGAESAVSAATAAVPERPRIAARPSIAGRAVVGARLIANRGSWSGGSLAFGYRWIRCRDVACRRGTAVGQGRTYRVRDADRGRRIRLTVTATNALGRASASSVPTRRVR
jgi:Subtilase family